MYLLFLWVQLQLLLSWAPDYSTIRNMEKGFYEKSLLFMEGRLGKGRSARPARLLPPPLFSVWRKGMDWQGRVGGDGMG